MILALIGKGQGSYGLGGSTLLADDFMVIGGSSDSGGVAVETDPTVPSHVKNITSTQITQWNSAYSWGNHSGLYKPSSYVPAWSEITGKPTFTRTVIGLVPAPGGSGTTRFLREDGNWATPSGTGGGDETPTHVNQITTGDIANWDAAYSWGNHASAGYVTQSYTDGRYVRRYDNMIDANGATRTWNNFTHGMAIGMSTNSTGSTGFPNEFGITYSFQWGGANGYSSNSNRGRDFDLWKRNAADELYWRGYSTGASGNPYSWKEIWHSGNVPNPITATKGTSATMPTTIFVGTSAEAPAVGSRNANTIYFLTT